MNRKSVINILCALSGHDCLSELTVWITLTAHTPHTMDDSYQPSIPDWCFQRNRIHTMYYPQLYAKIAEETQLRLFFYSMESGKPQVSLHSHSNSQFSISLLIQLISIPTI